MMVRFIEVYGRSKGRVMDYQANFMDNAVPQLGG